MSPDHAASQPLQFSLMYQQGKLRTVSTNSPFIDHFFQRVKLTQSEHTWINSAHDLKIFFTIVGQPPEQITRETCLATSANHLKDLKRLKEVRKAPQVMMRIIVSMPV